MILAAGRGERMGALTDRIPKPLLEIAGKTLIDTVIERLVASGITELVVNIAYRGEQIRQHLGDGRGLGARIEYSVEPDGALETGGGIVAALDLLGPAPFITVNSDVWTDFDFAGLGEPAGSAHLVLVPNPDHNRTGDFRLMDGKIVEIGGIMLTFSGIAVYRPELFAGRKARRFPLAPVLHEAARAGQVSGQLYRGRWLDVGTPERLALAERYASKSF